MTFWDDIAGVFNQGPDGWDARLKPSIEFISPEGNEFSAKWTGDSRSVAKKLGVFMFPKVAGNIVQDLDANSTQYSIPVSFDGKDCDLNAAAFFQATKERGPWTVTHPVHGFLELQLMSARETDESVSSGGIVLVETEWIEPIDPTTLLTAAEAAGLLDSAVDDLNNSAFDQFTEALDTSTEALNNSITAGVQGVANLVDFVLQPLTSSVDFIDNTMNAIQNGINDLLAATVLDVQSLAGQIQNLIVTPSLGTTNTNESQNIYEDLATGLSEQLPSADAALTAQQKNQSLIVELALSATISAYAKIATTGIQAAQAAGAVIPTTAITVTGVPIETRPQAVEAAQNTADIFAAITGNLEALQVAFEDKDIDDQYFAQALSYSDAAQLVAKTVAFLLVSSFNLKIERRFLLDRPRCPIEIAITEYQGTGGNDSNIDLFIRSNKLHGDEIYRLPAGREVVVYA